MVICSTSDIDNYCKYLSKAHTNCQLISNLSDQYQIQTKEHLEYTCIYSTNLLRSYLRGSLSLYIASILSRKKPGGPKLLDRGASAQTKNFSDGNDGDDIKTGHH